MSIAPSGATSTRTPWWEGQHGQQAYSLPCVQATKLQTATANIYGLLDSSAAYVSQLEHSLQDQIQHLISEVEQGLSQK